MTTKTIEKKQSCPIDQWLADLLPDEKYIVETTDPELVKIVLKNDDYTPMEFVVKVLCDTIKLSYAQATSLVLKAHFDGQCICGKCPPENAQQKVLRIMQQAKTAGHPLLVYIE